MSDELPTVWDAEAHTIAKHGILKSYLDAWSAILTRAQPGSELLFVDGFAGPGEYTKGEPGSPIVALNSILDHSLTQPQAVRFMFVESDRARHAHLVSRLDREASRIAASQRVVVDPPVLGECDTEIRKLIAERQREGRALGPALFFLDQFGYSQVPMTLMRDIMKHQRCEVFSYLNCQRMHQFLSDKTKWAGITDAYGDESWKAALGLTGQQRQRFLIETYVRAIRANANVRYAWSFAMFDSQAHLIHWLIFATNHIRGLEEMKRAMWKADSNGEYRFSDRVHDTGQQSFFSAMSETILAGRLADELAGRTMTEEQVKEFVLIETPFYVFKNAVNELRKEKKVSPSQKGKWPATFASQRNLFARS